MPATVLFGAQWGDEAKGKMTDLLADRADWIVRFQGGANSGHTLVVDGNKYVLHVVPTGVLRDGPRSLIGPGLVIDPEGLVKELDSLEERGVPARERVRVSDRAHLVMPYHRAVDGAREDAAEGTRLGTTRRGIGPAYSDKTARRGLRVGDLLDAEVLRTRLQDVARARGPVLEAMGLDPIDVDGLVETCLGWGRALEPLVVDASAVLCDALDEGRQVLFEGAQGALLDLDHGTYPYVTSSSSSALGVCAGAGVGPRRIDRVVAVMKAYQTRVGTGPMPTESDDATAERLRKRGNEYGSTTGRPRRCGWLDVPATAGAVRINHPDAIALTMLDVLSGFPEVRVCTAYRTPDGRELTRMPADLRLLDRVEPVWESMPGWEEEIDQVRDYDDLPQAARDFVERIEEHMGRPVAMVSVGPDRMQSLVRRPDLLFADAAAAR